MIRKSSILAVLFSVTPALASAQEEPKPSWKRDFDDVEVKRINPVDLPGPEESRFPTSLQSTTVLPKPTSLEALRTTASEISDRVVEVIAVVRPNVGFQTKPVYVRGHGVWISEKEGGADPVLITPLHWVKGAEKIVALPPASRRKGEATTAERRTIQHPDGDLSKLVKTGGAIEVVLRDADEHRNLVTLAAPPDDLSAPASGLLFFDYEGQSPTRVYGYSPHANNALVETRFIEPKSKRNELVFYLQTNYPVILGAPIVADDGRLLAMTAMRHPEDPERTLTVPPGALRRYVKKVQGLDVDKPE